MRVSPKWLLAGALGSGLLFGAVAPRTSQACGGLFCSSTMPVNQAAERIIFSFDRKAKKVTAVVEILYDGPSEKFAWILPVPGIPKPGVSTSALLDRLQQQTNPLYQLQRNWAGSGCASPGSNNGTSAPQPGVAPPMGPGDSKGGVTVLASGSVGPYAYDTIMVDPGLSDPAMVAIQWLQMNQYEVTSKTGEVLRPYLRDGLNLIAFRLNKPPGKMAGSIRPIMLTYDSEHPMIPIRPTAVAANNDMGILAFVLGDARAVPINFRTLELNEAALDWFNPNTSYNAVVTAAADEAGGQGFVTEFANSTGNGAMANSLYQEAGTVDAFRRTADSLAPAPLITDVIERFSTQSQGGFMGPFGARPNNGRVALDGVSDVLIDPKVGIVFPPGVTVDQVMSSPRCYLTPPSATTFYCDGKAAPEKGLDLTGFNKVEFLKAVEALIIAPLESTARLFADQPYLTRLYTTLSPAEMNMDPTFDINDELASQNVSNSHMLTLRYPKACPGDTSGDWEADFGDFIVRGTGNMWPAKTGSTMMPFNRRVTQLSARGQGMVITNNNQLIAAALGGSQPSPGSGSNADGGTSTTPPRADASGGCSVGGASSSGPAWLLLAGPALFWLRRRRPQTKGTRS